MADALWMKIRQVKWADYPTNGPANMQTLLKNLASRKLQRAMKASHQVWTALCGGGKVHPACIPCAPFLIEIMEISDPAVVDDIIQIFTSMVAEGGAYKEAVAEYQMTLRFYLQAEDQILAAKVKDLLDALSPKEEQA